MKDKSAFSLSLGEFGKGFFAFALIIQPLLVSWMLLKYFFNATVFDYIPFYSDEWHYWHETLTFSRVGFSGGYYVMNERPASLVFTHFGPHGPLFPALYGLIGRVFEWKPYSGVLINHFLLSFALLFFVWTVRPDLKKLAVLNLALLVFWPIHQFSVSNMQESLHQSFGILFAALLFRLAQQKNQRFTIWQMAFFAVLILASLTRATWSFVLIPYYLLLTPRWSPAVLLKTTFVILSFVALSFSFLVYSGAPSIVPTATVAFKNMLTSPSTVTFNLYMDYLERNTANLLSFYQPEEALVRLEALMLIIWGSVSILRKRLATDTSLAWLHLTLLFPILFVTFFTYDVGSFRDYRVIAPFLLIAILLIAMLDRNALLILVLVGSSLVVSQNFLRYYNHYIEPEYVHNTQLIKRMTILFEKKMIYSAKQSAWCNTLDLTAPYNNSYLQVSVPYGIGISILRDIKFEDLTEYLPLRAKYIFLNSEKDSTLLEAIPELQAIAKVPYGILYYNSASKCAYQ